MNAPCARGLPGDNGKRCPEHEQAPHTVEGAIALHLAFAPGAWVRAGWCAVVSGLDYRAALALAPDGCDRNDLTALLLQAEAGILTGLAKAKGD